MQDELHKQMRFNSLDFLRGVAVLLVITGHFFTGYASTHVCWTGVDLFFVLSGFFVSGILFREKVKKGTMHAGRFFIRRIFKIWPLFYTAFIMQFLYLHIKHRPPPTSQVISELLFVQNYVPGFMQVTWSLGIEEQFYILVAFLLPVIARFGKIKWVASGCVLIMILTLGLRIIHYSFFPRYNPYTHQYPLQFRADSLSAGVLISYYYHFHFQKFQRWVSRTKVLLFYLSIIFLLPAFIFSYSSKWIFTVGFTTTWLAYGAIVMLFAILPIEKGRWNYFFNKNRLALCIAWVGFYSYAVYLFHFFIGPGILSNFLRYVWNRPPQAIQFLIFLSADILFGYIISRLIEQPVLRWRNRVFPSSDRPVRVKVLA
jgi:peptidoglycan/LPS O-acetylase OafA/YrhL